MPPAGALIFAMRSESTIQAWNSPPSPSHPERTAALFVINSWPPYLHLPSFCFYLIKSIGYMIFKKICSNFELKKGVISYLAAIVVVVVRGEGPVPQSYQPPPPKLPEDRKGLLPSGGRGVPSEASVSFNTAVLKGQSSTLTQAPAPLSYESFSILKKMPFGKIWFFKN